MSFLSKYYTIIEERFIKNASDDQLRLEGANRNTNRGSVNLPSGKVSRNSMLFTPKKIKDWVNAVALATDRENPSLFLLSELYDHLLLDAHTVSVIESRVMRVLRSKFALIDANGDQNADLKKLFSRPWFEKFVSECVWSKFTGIKVLETYDTDENGELINTLSIPMSHIHPTRQEILKEAGDEKGESYCEGAVALYYTQIGEGKEIGILSQIATLILAKKQAMGAWLDYIEKFGIPPRIVTTDNKDNRRVKELLNMLTAMINNHVAVIQGNEKFEIGKMPESDAFKVFKEMLSFLNSEISKRILGQDGTTDNKDASGTYGSLKVLQEVADDRHESDKLFIKYIINKTLIPKLTKISSFYTSLNGYEFDWDETDEMSKNELIKSAVSLTNAGYILDFEQLAEKTGMPITGFASAKKPDADPLNLDQKKKTKPN